MHLSELDLNLLPVFDALSRERSVSRAAESLGLTQSAMSHALRRLRDYFQDHLFVRTPGGMAPTSKALALAPVVGVMMENVRKHLVPGAGFDPRRSERVFALSMTDAAEVYFLPTLIREFRRLAPDARLRVVPVPARDVSQALERRDIDLAFGSARIAHDGLFQQRVVDQPLRCMVADDNPLFADGMSLEAYLASPHIAVSPFGSQEDIFEWALRAQGLQRRFPVTSASFLALAPLLEHTDLIATVPLSLAAASRTRYAVRVLPAPVDGSGLQLRQVWHPRFHTDSGNVWFRQLVFDLFSGADHEQAMLQSECGDLLHGPTRSNACRT